MFSSHSSNTVVQQISWAVNLSQNTVLFLHETYKLDDSDGLSIPSTDCHSLLRFLKIKESLKNGANDNHLTAVAHTNEISITSNAHQTEVGGNNLLFGSSVFFNSTKQDEFNRILLQETADLKSKFLNNITHEFKAPITRIQGLTEIIRLQFNDPELEEYLDLIKLCADKLKFSAESILEFSKWNKETSRSGFQNTTIFLLLKGLMHDLDIHFQRRNIEVDLNCSDESFQIFTNPKIFKEAFRLILMTTIENTQEGSISIKIESENGQLNVKVVDSGKGIPSDFIFGEHSGATTSQSTATKNSRQKQRSGLILSIAADYLIELGGSLEAKQLSTQKNQLTVCLPTSLN